MSEAEYQIERQLKQAVQFGTFRSAGQVDVRAILDRVSTSEIKRIALEMYNEGLRTDEKFEKMNVQLMNSSYDLTFKQKNGLITFIMYAS